MAASGLLGATLGNSGVATAYWRVDATGPELPDSLAAVVAVDTAHPLASAASAVLARVRVTRGASLQPTDDTGCALSIGRDGTFCAGVLHGRVPEADDPDFLRLASHIGARQRRAAALARAEVLDSQASQLEEQATENERRAARLEADAEAVSKEGQTFPDRGELRAAEFHRADVARSAFEAREVEKVARLESEHAALEFQSSYAEWLERTRSRSLPGDLNELVRLRDDGTAAAEKLRKAAAPLIGKLAERLDGALGRYQAGEIAQSLTKTESEAQAAHRAAIDTQTEVRVLEETKGAEISHILARHEAAGARLTSLQSEIDVAGRKEVETAQLKATAETRREDAERELRQALPRAAQRLNELRTLLSVPGVVVSVLDSDALADDARLLEQVAAKLRGRKTVTMKTVRERADEARAKLAGIWSIDPGDDHGELLTYVLTHRDAAYTPIEAAAYAEKLKERAEQALAAKDERALREFVLGRLPGAIGTAWTRLQDWIDQVNRKMRSAAASSGVGVQVRAPLREDLAPAQREVYELSCKVSGAERTLEQQRRLRDALLALLAASERETMQERVASAVDIRDWVEVHYEVNRPGGKTQRWSSRTGLSGGERRLVVLAPMLAAVAAAYDRFGAKAPRLVALDEVPAEVDDRGREGLARYIAELDLDVVCTSYLWDGCPGAWDGVDAYDLEAGPDGTVVAFPMLVRGLSPIPEVAVPDVKTASVEGLE